MFPHLNPHSSDFWHISAPHPPFLHQLTMQSLPFEPGRPVIFALSTGERADATMACKAISFPRPSSRLSPNQPLNLRQRCLQRHLQRHLQVVSMCGCSTWCIITRKVSKLNVCRLLMLHGWDPGWEPEISCSKHFLVFVCLWERGWKLRRTHIKTRTRTELGPSLA